MVPKAICLQRRFSQEVSSSAACIAPRILDCSQSLAFSGAKFPTFSPHCTKNPWFFTGVSLFWCKFSSVFHIVGPTAPRILGFFFSQDHFIHSSIAWAPIAPRMLGFLQDIFHMLGPTPPNIVGFSQDFLFWCFHRIFLFWCFHRIFLFWCKISHMRIQAYHHGASRVCKIHRYSDPNQCLSVKLSLHVQK